MTSANDSVKINPARHTFFIALREGMAAGVIGVLLLTLLIAVKAVQTFSQNTFGEYVLYYFSGTNTARVQTLLVTLMGAVQALFAFKILYNRAASGTYFGLGLSRSQLFGCRYAAGALWLVAGVIIAMISGVVVNLIYSSHPGMILAAALPLTAGLLVTSLISYTVMAAVCSRAGTLTEALVYGLLALLIPTLLLTGFTGQLSAFLWGSPYGYRNIYEYDLPGSPVFGLTVVNPPLFFMPYLAARGSQTTEAPPTPAAFWGPVLGWLAVTAVLLWVARFFFIRRRVENTGIRGVCGPLAPIVLFPLLYAAFSVFLYLTSGYPVWPVSRALAAGAGLSAAVFCALAFPMGLIRRPRWKGLLAYPAYLAVSLAVAGVLATGAFGYSSYMPDAGDVESMSISYKGLPKLLPAGTSMGLFECNTNKAIKLTSTDDLALGMSLHEALIGNKTVHTPAAATTPADLEIRTYTLVEYTLDDGQVVQRFYPSVTLGLLEQMLALDETDAFRELWNSYMNGIMPESGSSINGHPIPYSSSSFPDGVLYFAAPLSERAIVIDNENAALIRQALREDMADQSIQNRYSPVQAEQYTLYFCRDHGTNSESQAPWINLNDTFAFMATARLCIDASSPRTLSLLTGYAQQPEIPQIESIQVLCPYAELLADDSSHDDLTACFSALITDQQSSEFRISQYDINPLCTATDPDQIAELYAASRGFYFAGDDGYLIYVRLKDSDAVFTRYIPRLLLPDWAR